MGDLKLIFIFLLGGGVDSFVFEYVVDTYRVASCSAERYRGVRVVGIVSETHDLCGLSAGDFAAWTDGCSYWV